MIDWYVVFWTTMIIGSIAWYGFLLFLVGYKGGREIGILTKTLHKERSSKEGEGK